MELEQMNKYKVVNVKITLSLETHGEKAGVKKVSLNSVTIM